MDFIDDLPKSQNKDVVLVVVDRLFKYANFITPSHPYIAQSVAWLFVDNIFKLHGIPLQLSVIGALHSPSPRHIIEPQLVFSPII